MEHKIKKLYTLETRLNNICKEEARQMKAITDSIEGFQDWKIKARCKLKTLLSLERFEEVPLCPELIESFEVKDYIREKIVLQTERDVKLPLFFLIPKKNRKEKLPIVLLIPGNDSDKMEMVQEKDDLQTKATHNKEKDVLALRLVRQGYAVAVLDIRGAGERSEYGREENDGKKVDVFSRDKLNKIAIALGYSLSGMDVWDAIRTIDYLQMRKEFDGRLFCGGKSYGGMLSLYLAAVDERIKGSFVSGCFYGFQSRLMQSSQDFICDYVPDMWRYFEISDIAAISAPKPLFIECDDKYGMDAYKEPETAFQHIWQTRDVYQCLDAENNLQHCVYHGDGKRAFQGDELIKFLNTLSSGIKIPKSLPTWLFNKYMKDPL